MPEASHAYRNELKTMTPIPTESHIYRAKFCVRDDINCTTPESRAICHFVCYKRSRPPGLEAVFSFTGFRNYNLNTSDFPAALFLLGWIRIF